MKLLDTNILIYSGEAIFAPVLLPFVTDTKNFVSVISKIETLGFTRITPSQIVYFENIFQILQSVAVDDAIIQKATALRQLKKMTLGDALIAASALVLKAELITRNTSDFIGIPGLKVMNPIL